MGKTKNDTNSKKSIIIFSIISAVVAIIAVVAVLMVINTNSQKPVGTVQFSTNPSVTMVINDSDRVIEVQYLNEDAEILLSKTDLVGKHINEASRLFAKICSETGYINATKDSPGAKVEIIVTNTSDKKVDELGAELCATMNDYFDDNGIIAGAAYLKLSDVKDAADAMGVSQNKYILIKSAQKMYVDYTESELIAMSEAEILQAIKDKSNDLRGVSQEYYDAFSETVNDAVGKLETAITTTIGAVIATIQTVVPDFELKVDLDMTFKDLKKQITDCITDENVKQTVSESLDKFEKVFNETKDKIVKEISKAQEKIIEDSKAALDSAKNKLEGRYANYKQDVAKVKEYYDQHKDEVDAKIKAFRDSITIDVDAIWA